MAFALFLIVLFFNTLKLLTAYKIDESSCGRGANVIVGRFLSPRSLKPSAD
jgi:hypothetical protein